MSSLLLTRPWLTGLGQLTPRRHPGEGRAGSGMIPAPPPPAPPPPDVPDITMILGPLKMFCECYPAGGGTLACHCYEAHEKTIPRPVPRPPPPDVLPPPMPRSISPRELDPRLHFLDPIDRGPAIDRLMPASQAAPPGVGIRPDVLGCVGCSDGLGAAFVPVMIGTVIIGGVTFALGWTAYKAVQEIRKMKQAGNHAGVIEMVRAAAAQLTKGEITSKDFEAIRQAAEVTTPDEIKDRGSTFGIPWFKTNWQALAIGGGAIAVLLMLLKAVR